MKFFEIDAVLFRYHGCRHSLGMTDGLISTYFLQAT